MTNKKLRSPFQRFSNGAQQSLLAMSHCVLVLHEAGVRFEVPLACWTVFRVETKFSKTHTCSRQCWLWVALQHLKHRLLPASERNFVLDLLAFIHMVRQSVQDISEVYSMDSAAFHTKSVRVDLFQFSGCCGYLPVRIFKELKKISWNTFLVFNRPAATGMVHPRPGPGSRLASAVRHRFCFSRRWIPC